MGEGPQGQGEEQMSTWASMAKRLNNKVWSGQSKEWMLVRVREAREMNSATWSANTRAITTSWEAQVKARNIRHHNAGIVKA